MGRIMSRAVLLLGLALASFGTRAEGLMLYWRIGEQNEIAFDYAVLYAVDTTKGEGATPIALPNDGQGGLAYVSDESGLKTASLPGVRNDGLHTELDSLLALGDANPSAYAFYIELVRWDDVNKVEEVYGISESATYGDLVDNYHIVLGGLTPPDNMVVWTPATVVPEPSGVSLLLLGLGLLALKRPGGRSR